MSLYKNMFRFILDDSITGKAPLKENNSLYRAFFEGVLEEDVPPASDFGFKAIPYTSPTEYVELGQEGVPGARHFKRDIAHPERFTPIGRGGKRPATDQYYTEPTDANVSQQASPESKVLPQELPPQNIKAPEAPVPTDIFSQGSSIEPVSGKPITMHPGDVFTGEISGMSRDDIKMLEDGSIQIGYLNIKREVGVPIYSNEPDIQTTAEDIQNCAVYRKKKKEVMDAGEPEKEADAAAELYTQNIMVGNRLVDMVHRLWDEKTKTLLAHVKPVGTGNISLSNMAGSMLAGILAVAKSNYTTGAYGDYSEKFNKFVAQDMTSENIDAFIKSSWKDISVLLGNPDGTLNEGAIPSYYESLDCIIKAGTAKSEGFLLIPFRKNEPGMDSISIFNHTSSIKGFRANAVEFVPSQVKYKTGAGGAVDDKLYSTVYQGLYSISQNRMISGLEAFGDIQKIRSPEVIGDLMSTPTEMINGKKVKITDREIIVNMMENRVAKANAELDKLFNTHSTAILLGLGRDDDHRLTEEQIEEMHKDPVKLNDIMKKIKAALSKGQRNDIMFTKNSEGRVIGVTVVGNLKRPPTNYGEPSMGNERYSDLTERVWGAWFLGNEMLCSIANEHAHSQGITLARYSDVSLTYTDGGLEEPTILNKKTNKKETMPDGVGLVYHNQHATKHASATDTKNKPFMFKYWLRTPNIYTHSAPQTRKLVRFGKKVKEYITSVYQHYRGCLLRG